MIVVANLGFLCYRFAAIVAVCMFLFVAAVEHVMSLTYFQNMELLRICALFNVFVSFAIANMHFSMFFLCGCREQLYW